MNSLNDQAMVVALGCLFIAVMGWLNIRSGDRLYSTTTTVILVILIGLTIVVFFNMVLQVVK